MSKRKRVAVTTAIICALFGIIYLAVSFLPYNKNSKWSSLYFEADLGKIYGQSLDELKRAYKELTSIDYYEINNQFLEISYPEIDSEFLYGFEYGNPETRNNGNGEIYLTKCFQISKNCIEKFGLEVKDGNTFSDDDMKYVSGKYIPVIVGSDYADTLKVGDLLKGVYIQDEFTYEVIGVLSKGANINLGGHEVSLDRYLVMPSFDIEEDPINAEDDMFQVRHYANKLSGKLHYDSFMQFLEFYKRIFDIHCIIKCMRWSNNAYSYGTASEYINRYIVNFSNMLKPPVDNESVELFNGRDA